MKIKTSELSGDALDYAVAVAEGMRPHAFVEPDCGQGAVRSLARWCGVNVCPSGHTRYEPSTDWAQGGPIIEREDIDVLRDDHDQTNKVERFAARKGGMVKHPQRDAYFWCVFRGPTKLVAAMRCYVASKLGDEVDVPEELT